MIKIIVIGILDIIDILVLKNVIKVEEEAGIKIKTKTEKKIKTKIKKKI